MNKPKFQVGDRVYIPSFDVTGRVTAKMDHDFFHVSFDKPSIHIKYPNASYTYGMSGYDSEFTYIDVYNSPLYKLLQE